MWRGAVGSYPGGGEWLITDVFFLHVDGPITRVGWGGGGGAYKQNFYGILFIKSF